MTAIAEVAAYLALSQPRFDVHRTETPWLMIDTRPPSAAAVASDTTIGFPLQATTTPWTAPTALPTARAAARARMSGVPASISFTKHRAEKAAVAAVDRAKKLPERVMNVK